MTVQLGQLIMIMIQVLYVNIAVIMGYSFLQKAMRLALHIIVLLAHQTRTVFHQHHAFHALLANMRQAGRRARVRFTIVRLVKLTTTIIRAHLAQLAQPDRSCQPIPKELVQPLSAQLGPQITTATQQHRASHAQLVRTSLLTHQARARRSYVKPVQPMLILIPRHLVFLVVLVRTCRLAHPGSVQILIAPKAPPTMIAIPTRLVFHAPKVNIHNLALLESALLSHVRLEPLTTTAIQRRRA